MWARASRSCGKLPTRDIKVRRYSESAAARPRQSLLRQGLAAGRRRQPRSSADPQYSTGTPPRGASSTEN